ncbi:hypothetical protein EZJ49_15875 [Bdellovibrio bacteriovorus]|uniref:hypothetical protein n=1 Tax=Bdellovibrio bacteriovorus TaxID=959 RepID=UPI0021D0CB6D|nr:hypothetical protein [Bdellovibrio bacteriovorus]UXR64548.1 hypothetical protein EZJ49_15875 [Bdellovibrio bacteriovorus]
MKCLVTFILLLSGFNSWAGGEGVFDRGNGGDVVICNSEEGPRYQLLDMYELKQRGFSLWSYATMETSASELLNQVLNRLSRRHPQFVRELRYELFLFTSEVKFISGRLPNVQDEGHYVLEEGCYLEQLAVQWTEKSSFGRRYDISLDLWDKLDAKNQAALILHELVYRLVIKKSKHPGVKTSVEFRTYVALFFSEEYEWAESEIDLPPTIWPIPR